MTRLDQLRDRLPSLYRPDDDTGLLSRFLKASADVLEQLNRDASDVLQSHWFEYADRARFSRFFLLDRQLRELPVPPVNDPELFRFAYIADLGRQAGLLGLPPRQDPVLLRETVEAYRLRVRRIVALYRNGLGTLGALRSMVEAQLPAEFESPSGAQDRPFWLEEFAPQRVRSLAIPTRGEPSGMVGPLMRWSLSNEGLVAIPPTIYIQGVEPDDGVVGATENPTIELYHAGDVPIRTGIAYRGTLAAGDTLRLRPAYGSWIGLDNAIRSAVVQPETDRAADPTAPGPWQDVSGAPTDVVVDMQQTCDRVLWVATHTNAGDQLWRADTRYDGSDNPRGVWRYDRRSSTWQQYGQTAADWESYAEPPSSPGEPSVRVVTWTDHVVADIGQCDGTHFTADRSVAATDLVVRHKPSAQRMVDGGIPAIPRLPVGTSTWRYLSLEPDTVQSPDARPWWTQEGRLLPPPPDTGRLPGRDAMTSRLRHRGAVSMRPCLPTRPPPRCGFPGSQDSPCVSWRG